MSQERQRNFFKTRLDNSYSSSPLFGSMPGSAGTGRTSPVRQGTPLRSRFESMPGSERR